MKEFRVVPATEPLRGSVQVPADKSISHRAAILSALAVGETRIDNWLRSGTTDATLQVLQALGVRCERPGSGTVVVQGCGLHSLHKPHNTLFCRGSGTTMRLMAGVCAGQEFSSVLDGTPALKRRPMRRVIDPLRLMGARINAGDNESHAPLEIRGGGLVGIDYTLPVASAQAKSAILLASLFATGPTTVREPAASRDHTERMLRTFGVHIERHGTECCIRPATELTTPSVIQVPNDFSSAAFLVVAALLIRGSSLCLPQVGTNPLRTGLLDVLAKMGARVTSENSYESSGEPVADLVVESQSNLVGGDVDGADIPRMIDEFPVLAVAATQAQGETRVRDARELRVKESDRISALASELHKMGAHIQEKPDGFIISGPTLLKGARVSAHNDHRLAMALAVAGLVAQGATVIEGWECVSDSFPRFGNLLFQLASGHNLANDGFKR